MEGRVTNTRPGTKTGHFARERNEQLNKEPMKEVEPQNIEQGLMILEAASFVQPFLLLQNTGNKNRPKLLRHSPFRIRLFSIPSLLLLFLVHLFFCSSVRSPIFAHS
jgi:hypothetical protein